ncbi:MAG: MerR family transcriptional regulator [Oscillospiraceae bacterium]|jgi:DNA-binding transcriptional MerR regulator/DNA-directed RNA polymerase subunit RPC12/RpoP|nr:MerR family transcriptional regulator [Oscillospiraceae bacterium]
MPQYTTGDLARLCDVSVRTVQFYDSKDLLKPAELTEGGRRLYSDDDLKKLQLICMLKSLGLSLDSIRGILESDAPGKVLLLLLEEQERRIGGEISGRQKQLRAIRVIKENIRNESNIPVKSISDIEHRMTSKKKLRKIHGIMMAVGIIMDVIELGTLLLWILKGVWLPFAIGMPIVILMAVLLFRMYYRSVAYICPECNTVFQPSVKDVFFGRHMPKTRKLRCTSCGYNGYCVETASLEGGKA